jgi:TonB family protein
MKYTLLLLFTCCATVLYSQQKTLTREIDKKEKIISIRADLKSKKNQFPTKKPVYIIAGTIYTMLDLKSMGMDTTDIKSIEVLLPKAAIKKYGAKAKNGALVITLGGEENQVGNAQIVEPPPETRIVEKDTVEDMNKIFTKVEAEATFKSSWILFLQKNLKYPKEAMDYGIKGIVIVNFVVEIDGTVNNIKMDTNSPQKNELLVAEAIRVIKKTNGQWKPAQQNGREIRSIKKDTFKFLINDND